MMFKMSTTFLCCCNRANVFVVFCRSFEFVAPFASKRLVFRPRFQLGTLCKSINKNMCLNAFLMLQTKSSFEVFFRTPWFLPECTYLFILAFTISLTPFCNYLFQPSRVTKAFQLCLVISSLFTQIFLSYLQLEFPVHLWIDFPAHCDFW